MNSLRDTRVYSNLLILNEYSAKVNRKGHLNSKMAAFKVAKEYKIIHANTKTASEKIKQIKKVLFSSNISITKCSSFFYSIDEHIILEHKGMVIGNFPVDYSLIVNYSFEDIIRFNKEKDNEISRQNLDIIEIILEYLNYVVKVIEKSDIKRSIKSDIIDSLIGLINRKANSLKDALQRILFVNSIIWQTGHSLMGLGRLDKILDIFPCDESTDEILKEFLSVLHEFYNFKSTAMLGDTGQIIILGGLDADGSYFCNDYTYRFIEVAKLLHLPDPKLLLRVSESMPGDLLKSAVKCISTGIGSPLLSNDDKVIPAIIDFGYEYDDAYNYGVSACWEPLIIGKSFEQNNIGHIEFGKAMAECLRDSDVLSVYNFDEFKKLYFSHLKVLISKCLDQIDLLEWEYDPVLTVFTLSCLKNNKDISRGGAKYNNYGLLSVGLSSAVDSLLNIKHLCINSRRYTIKEIVQVVLSNYEDAKNINNILSSISDGFGTSNNEAISLTKEIVDFTENEIQNYKNKLGGGVKFGLSSPNYINLGHTTLATADGRRNGTPFKTHISNDQDSPTDIVLFASQLDYSGKKSNGNVVDVMLLTSIMSSNIDKLIDYIRTSIRLGVFQIQFNVVSYKQLLAAKNNPENFPHLIVRVWGFSAYFRDLPEVYKDVLIERARISEGIT